MKKYLKYFKNRYVISSLMLVLYILLLHDTDVFSLQKRKDKVANLEKEIVHRRLEIEDLKKADEDLFVLSDK